MGLVGRVVLGLIGGTAVAVAGALPTPMTRARLSESWRWRDLGAPAGLVGEVHLAVARDGALLAASNNLVAIYDGYRWRPLDRPVESSRRAVRVVAAPSTGFLIDSGTAVWAASSTGEQRLVRENRLDGALLTCPSGDLLLVSAGALSFWRDDHFEVIARGPGAPVRGGGCIGDGDVVVTAGATIWRWRDFHWQALAIPHNLPAEQLFERVIVGSRNAVVLPAITAADSFVALELDAVGATHTISLREINIPPASAALLPDGTLLATSAAGDLVIYEDAHWYELNVEQLAHDSATTIAVDRGGRLIVVTLAGRVLVCDLTSNRWESTPVRPGRAIHAITRGDDGSLWLGTQAGLENWRGGRLVQHWEEALGEPLRLLTTVQQASDGSLWVGSGSQFRGAYRLAHGRWSLVRAELGDLFVHAIRRAPDDALWFVGFGGNPGWTRGGAIARFAAGRWKVFGPSDGLPNDRYYDVAFAHDGSIVVAGAGGLLRGDGERFDTMPNVVERGFFSLFRASDGTIYAGRGLRLEGVGQLVKGEYRPLVDPEGAALFAGSWAESIDGKLWFGSKFGLAMYDGTAVNRLTREPGCNDLMVWPVLAGTPAEGGGVWFGAMDGALHHFGSDDLDPPRTEAIRLDHTDDSGVVRLSWSASDRWNVTPPSALRYLVQIDDRALPRFSSSPSIELSSLRSGRHRITVQAVDLVGNRERNARSFEFVVPAPLGHQPWFLALLGTALAALATLAVVLYRRTSERRAAWTRQHRALAASEHHFRTLVEQAELVLIRADLASRLTYISPQIGEITGLAPSAFMRRPHLLHRLIHTDDQPQLRALAEGRNVRRPRTVHADLRVVHRDGSWRRVIVRQTPSYDENGAPRGFDAAVLDVTQRTQMEDALARMEKMESLGVMAGGVAHDFNNLLVVILGNAELARSAVCRGLTPLAELDAIAAAGQRAADVCRQMLVFTGRSPSAHRPVDARAVIGEVELLLRASVPRSTRIDVELADDPLPVLGDTTQLHQIVMNLVLNAAEACEGHAGRILVGARSVVLERQQLDAATLGRNCAPGNYVELVVADNGRGMDETTLARIFDPFFSTKFAGRGLGLAAVLGIVRSHNGCIAVDSRVDVGTAFRVYLPAVTAADEKAGLPPPTPPASGHGELLVVDHEPLVLELVATILRGVGFEVLALSSGSVAAETVHGRPGRFVAAIVDLTLRDSGGRELAFELRRHAPQLPILLCSSYAVADPKQFEATGDRFRFIQKPFTRQQLLDAVFRLLANYARRDAS